MFGLSTPVREAVCPGNGSNTRCYRSDVFHDSLKALIIDRAPADSRPVPLLLHQPVSGLGCHVILRVQFPKVSLIFRRQNICHWIRLSPGRCLFVGNLHACALNSGPRIFRPPAERKESMWKEEDENGEEKET